MSSIFSCSKARVEFCLLVGFGLLASGSVCGFSLLASGSFFGLLSSGNFLGYLFLLCDGAVLCVDDFYILIF